MPIGRREFLMAAAPLQMSACSTDRSNHIEGALESVSPVYPHLPLSLSHRKLSHKTVFALWHFFPLSFDNRPQESDYWTKNFLNPSGENGKHASYGGFVRDRPIPIVPNDEDKWRVNNAVIDITMASESGVDAFIYNISSITSNRGYFEKLSALQHAAQLSNSRFRLVPCIDLATLKHVPILDVAAAMVPALRHETCFRMRDGRPLLASFAAEIWTPDQWLLVINELNRVGLNIAFLPIFLDSDRITPELAKTADIIGCWTGNHLGSISRLHKVSTYSKDLGKEFLWPIWPQDCRPKDGWYAESSNSELFRAGWQNAIDSNPAYVGILTWNDYAESSHIRPSLGTQFAFADLNRFYSDWYRLGYQPKILRDVLYYFHRRDFSGPQYGTYPSRAMRMRFGESPVDEAEVVAFLTDRAEVSVSNAKSSTTTKCNAGIASCRNALGAGRQKFELRRGSEILISLASHVWVRDRWDWQDLVYRGGSSSRNVTELMLQLERQDGIQPRHP